MSPRSPRSPQEKDLSPAFPGPHADAALAAPLAPGALIDGAYRLVRLISDGGMGTVYEAIQVRLDRRVAVKVLSGDLADDPEARARFRREVKITSKLAHPHVVQLLDFGITATGRPYLVTEYVEGEDLERRLNRVGRLSLDVALPIIRQVVSGLAAIHARAVVHRDLKPGNVLLLSMDDAADFVKLADFGISKLTTSSTALTAPSSILGTPGFMSPEQASGLAADVDHRSDQWALGAMVWYMLSGAPPFTSDSLTTLLDRVVNEAPPPLRATAPALPDGVEPVLLRALAKKRSQRYPTVTAFLRAFEAAAKSPR